MTNLFLAAITIIGSLIVWIFLTQRADVYTAIGRNAHAVAEVNRTANALTITLAQTSVDDKSQDRRIDAIINHANSIDDHLTYIDRNQARLMEHVGMVPIGSKQ